MTDSDIESNPDPDLEPDDEKLLAVQPAQLTQLINSMSEGDKDAEDFVFRELYYELRQQAERYMGRQRRHHSLWATELVHSAYVKVCGTPGGRWRNREHFLAVAAKAMWSILVDHARSRGRQKRKAVGDREPLDALVDGFSQSFTDRAVDLLDLHEAMKVLKRVYPRSARVVELRFMLQLPMKEVADTMGIPKRTADREWAFARSWLLDRLEHGTA